MDPDEDRFVLREKDPVGPATITEWCRLRRNRALKLYGADPVGDAKRLLDAELLQCREAEEKALAWADRQAGGEAEDGRKATYVDVILTEEQVLSAKRQKLQTELERNLSEADYCAHELISLDGPAVTAELGEQAQQIHALAIAARQTTRAKAA